MNNAMPRFKPWKHRRRASPAPMVVKNAEEIIDNLVSTAPAGGHKCPGCGQRHLVGSQGRPACENCWIRLPLELRQLWKNRIAERAQTEAKKVVKQWFLDNPPEE